MCDNKETKYLTETPSNVGGGSRYVCWWLCLRSCFQFRWLPLSNEGTHETVDTLDNNAVQDSSLLLNSPNSSNTLRTMYGLPASDRGPSLGLPGPVPGPAHLHSHAPAPVGPNGQAPASPWRCHSHMQSSRDQMMGCVAVVAGETQTSWPTLHHDTVTEQKRVEGINVGVKIHIQRGTFHLYLVCKFHTVNNLDYTRCHMISFGR